MNSNTFSGGTFFGDGSNLTGIDDFYVVSGTTTGGTLTLTRNDGNDVVITGLANNYLPTMETFNGTQALTGTYTQLTNMTRDLVDGTYVVKFSGAFIAGGNDVGGVAIFIDGNEVDGTLGHTYREFGATGLFGVSSNHSVDTQTLVTITGGTQTVDIQGLEVTGTAISFEGGSLIIERKI